jgi:hypothetical protein
MSPRLMCGVISALEFALIWIISGRGASASSASVNRTDAARGNEHLIESRRLNRFRAAGRVVR